VYVQGITKQPTAGVTWMAGERSRRDDARLMRGFELALALLVLSSLALVLLLFL
jgi:hypothetical protein